MVETSVVEVLRVCGRCLVEKPLANFPAGKRSKNGRRAICVGCDSAAARYRRQKDRSKSRINNKRYRDRVKGTVDFKKKQRERQRLYRSRPEVMERQRAWDRKYRLTRKAWEKKSQMRTKYGLTMELFREMLETQGHRCPICGNDIAEQAGGNMAATACVDHCHKTGKVRGLLCGPCNVGLGSLGDCPSRLESGARYLRSHE